MTASDRKPVGWDRFPNPTSAPVRFSKLTTEQLILWSDKLGDIWPKDGEEYDERDAIIYWNIISAVFTLTEFEGESVTAMAAHEFSGASLKTGQRKYAELKKKGLLITSENPDDNKVKFVTASDKAGKAILETFDAWTRKYDAVTQEYKNFRRKQGVVLD